MFEVLFYEKEDGTRPAEEYLLSEDIKIQAKMDREILLLEEFGNLLRKPQFQKKTKKTPKDVIELAKKYREDYLKRSNKDGI